jgi:hypothetical protein
LHVVGVSRIPLVSRGRSAILKQKENFGMSNDPKGFEENPQLPLSAEDDEGNVIDESIWGPQRVLTAEEQADYDAWLRKKVSRSMASIADGTAVFKSHEDVVNDMKSYLDQLDRKAGIR